MTSFLNKIQIVLLLFLFAFSSSLLAEEKVSDSSEISKILKTINAFDWGDISRLPEEERVKTLSPQNLVIVSNDLERLAKETDNPDVYGMRFYLEYFRDAYYHQFYGPEKYPYTLKEHKQVQKALKAVAKMSIFKNFDDRDVEDLRGTFLIALDSTLSSHLFLEEMKFLLNHYLQNLEEFLNSSAKWMPERIFYNFYRDYVWTDQHQTPWYNRQEARKIWNEKIVDLKYEKIISDFLQKIANSENEKAGRLTQEIARFVTTIKDSHPRILEKTLQIKDKISNQSLRFEISTALTNGGIQIENFKEDKAEFKKWLFPEISITKNTQGFNQIKIHHSLGETYKPEYVQQLFDSFFEVETMFMKFCPFDSPAPKDKNENLSIFIQKNPERYDSYQMSLFNVSSQNGGIYIEGRGTLYTFDRTKKQNIFPLHELSRHEVIHALDSRYNIVGSYGDPNTLYDIVQTNFAWYLEGLAEALVGTHKDKVFPRKTLLRRMKGMKISEIVDCGYEKGFSFYSDAGIFFAFLANHYPEVITNLMSIVRENDTNSFLEAAQNFKEKENLQKEYEEYVRSLKQLPKNSPQFFENVDPLGYGEKFYKNAN